MSKPKILLQLDADHHPSVFDSVVAIDAGVDHLLAHGGIEPTAARALVHGAMFTRGPADLHHEAGRRQRCHPVLGRTDALGELLVALVHAQRRGRHARERHMSA